MAHVKIGKDESIDKALRRFRNTCRKAGLMSEMTKRKHYVKPSVKRKQKADAARKRGR